MTVIPTTDSTLHSQNDTLGQSPLLLRLADSRDEQQRRFLEFVRLNPDFRIEQAASGEVTIMPPTGGESGSRNSVLNARVVAWAELKGGKVFDSSTMFVLPNGAKRSPDVAWIASERWQKLTDEQREDFPPLCPDFVIELRSKTDRLVDLKRKLSEYADNGARLGWLIDPIGKQVHIYRPNQPPEILDSPQLIFGESVLPGFRLDCTQFW